MKLSRRIPALLLALVMLVSVCLTGCQSKQDQANIAPPDEVAVALFDLIIRNDAAAAQKALGYESEEAVREDFMGGSEEDLSTELAEQLAFQFASMGATVSDEDSKLLVDSVLSMLSKLEFTAEVKEQDDAAGTAVVTCHISSYAPTALNDAITDSAMDLASDPELANDTDALMSALIQAICGAMEDLEPSGETTDFDTEFSLQKVEVSGKTQSVWVPVDAQGFGEALSTAAMGG